MTQAGPAATIDRMATTFAPSTAARGIEMAVALRGVAKGYGSVRAVRGVTVEIPCGQTVAVLGPNGAGKTTTLGMLTGLIRPDRGTVEVAGAAPRTAVEAGRIAAMPQDAGLMPGVTVGQLVRLAAAMYPDPLPVPAALELAGLSELAGRRVDRLSGGQAQRAKFALVAVANPEILVLDEPTRALDVAARRDFWAAMRSLAERGRTVVFATHYLDEVAENADRVVVMAGGRVVADGDPDEIRRTTSVTSVAFTLADEDSTLDHLADLPGVRAANRSGTRVVLESSDADATIRALSASTLPWRDLSVAVPSLDDSYLALTATGPQPSTEE
jgi:ABC-2 type transport system ATP-binding protein